MFRMNGKTAELLRYRVAWNRSGANGTEGCEAFCSTAEEKDALVARLRNEKRRTAVSPAGVMPNPDERFLLQYNRHRGLVFVDGAEEEGWADDLQEACPWNAGTAPSGDRVLRYNQWMKTTFSVTGADYGNFEMFFKYGNGTDAYIRAVKLYPTDAPDRYLRWGLFSEENGPVDNTFHLRPGFTYVDMVEKEGVLTCHLPGNWAKAHIEVDETNPVIPMGTAALTVEVEYWVEDPVGLAAPPAAQERPVNTEIVVETLDLFEQAWIDGLAFDHVEDAQAALEAGEEAYCPPVKETTQLEQDITALQLALVELYEGGTM